MSDKPNITSIKNMVQVLLNKKIYIDFLLLITLLFVFSNLSGQSINNCSPGLISDELMININRDINLDSVLSIYNKNEFCLIKIRLLRNNKQYISICYSDTNGIVKYSNDKRIDTISISTISLDENLMEYYTGKKNTIVYTLVSKIDRFHSPIDYVYFRLKGKIIMGYSIDDCNLVEYLISILDKTIMSNKIGYSQLNSVLVRFL